MCLLGKIWDSHSGITEDWSLLVRYDVLLGKELPLFTQQYKIPALLNQGVLGYNNFFKPTTLVIDISRSSAF